MTFQYILYFCKATKRLQTKQKIDHANHISNSKVPVTFAINLRTLRVTPVTASKVCKLEMNFDLWQCFFYFWHHQEALFSLWIECKANNSTASSQTFSWLMIKYFIKWELNHLWVIKFNIFMLFMFLGWTSKGLALLLIKIK